MYLPHGVQVWIPLWSSLVSNPGPAMNLPHAGPGLDPAWFQTSFQPRSSYGFTSFPTRVQPGLQPRSSYELTSCGSRSGSCLGPDKFPAQVQVCIYPMLVQLCIPLVSSLWAGPGWESALDNNWCVPSQIHHSLSLQQISLLKGNSQVMIHPLLYTHHPIPTGHHPLNTLIPSTLHIHHSLSW